MVPPRFLCPALVLLCGHLATAQTVVNSIYVGPADGTYSPAKNWAPAEVPNNTDAKVYNVTIPPTSFVLSVDVDATISNLTLGSFLYIYGKTLTVTGTTLSAANQAPNMNLVSDPNAPATFNAGVLASFSDNTLRGRYLINSILGSPATVQFKGANVITLSGELSLYGAFARVLDENGSDALQNLGLIENGAVLSSDGHNLTTTAPFTNNGTLDLGGDFTTIFTAVSSLTNFDSGTRTLSGGKFVLDQFAGGSGNLPTELRFAGADIVSNDSAIELGGTARITDLAGADGLRNLANNLPGASLTLRAHDFATTGGFRNDGLLSLTRSTFIVTGPFANFDPAARTLSGGTYEITDRAGIKFSGADIVNNGALVTLAYGGSITDITGSNGLRNFSNNLAGAAFVLGQAEDFTASGDFTNAGRVETAGYYGGIPENPPVYGTFTVPAGFAYTQTAGTTANDGIFTADRINIFGGSLVSGIGTITGNVTVTDATIFPGLHPTVNGNVTLNSGSHYHTSIDRFGEIGAFYVTGTVAVAGTLDIEISDQIFLGRDAILTVLRSNTSITGAFGNAPNGTRIPTIDGRGSFVVVFEPKRVTLTQFMATPPPAQLLNISTRAFLSRPSDDTFGTRSVLIGGFIISGVEPKTVALRGIGPSLSKFGLDPALADPILELHASNGGVIATNDNWKDSQQGAITQSGLAPGDDREAAIIATLDPGSYTVRLKEKSGLAGHGVVEVYDLSKDSSSKLANISTLGYTDASTLLIGGVIVAGDGQANDEVVVRAIGPQLRRNGVFNALDDPTLELRDGNGGVVASNDDWGTNFDQIPSEFRPFQSAESAVRVSLPRGSYTAIVRAKANSGGVALVEFYDLRR